MLRCGRGGCIFSLRSRAVAWSSGLYGDGEDTLGGTDGTSLPFVQRKVGRPQAFRKFRRIADSITAVTDEKEGLSFVVLNFIVIFVPI